MEKKIYKYYRISYSSKNDSYSGWMYVGENKYPEWDEFDFEIECPCVKGMIFGVETKDCDYIHYNMLTSIKRAMESGYDVSFVHRPE